MKTITVSKTYSLKWQVKGHEHYAISPCGKIFNLKKIRLIKRIRVGSSIGYCIDGKFMTLTALRPMLEKITESELPF